MHLQCDLYRNNAVFPARVHNPGPSAFHGAKGRLHYIKKIKILQFADDLSSVSSSSHHSEQ